MLFNRLLLFEHVPLSLLHITNLNFEKAFLSFSTFLCSIFRILLYQLAPLNSGFLALEI